MNEQQMIAEYAHSQQRIAQAAEQTAIEQQRPCVLLRPQLYRDGNKWCALYGDDLQNGIAGFGDTPVEAMNDFDRCYYHDTVR